MWQGVGAGVTLVLSFPAPGLPMSENASRRKHWAERKRELAPWGEWAARRWAQTRLSLDGLSVYRKPCDVTVWLPFPNRRRRDPHNFVGTVVKVIIDALVDEQVTVGKQRVRTYEGIWPDDTPEWVSIREPKLYVGEDCVVEIVPRAVSTPEEPPTPSH
jgi:hypothetical protein